MRQNSGPLYSPLSGGSHYGFPNDPTSTGVNTTGAFMGSSRGNGPLMVEGRNNPAQREWDQLLMEHNRGKGASLSGAGSKRISSSSLQAMHGQHLNDASWNPNHPSSESLE